MSSFCTRCARSSSLGFVILFGCSNLVKPPVNIEMYFIKKVLSRKQMKESVKKPLGQIRGAESYFGHSSSRARSLLSVAAERLW